MNRRLSRSIRAALSCMGLNTVRHSVHGHRYRLPLACTSLKHLFFTRDSRYEGDFYPFVLSLARPGDVVFDIGAHLGKYVIGLADRIRPSGRVVAFEANPVTAGYLRQIVHLNQLEDVVETINAAVGANPGRLTLSLTGDGCDPGQNALPCSGQLHPCQVDLVTVDDFVRRRGLVPHLIKIDVEGYELRVLEGARHTLDTIAPIVCCEIHPARLAKLGLTVADVELFLSHRGYSCAGQQPAPAGLERSGRPYNVAFSTTPSPTPGRLADSSPL